MTEEWKALREWVRAAPGRRLGLIGVLLLFLLGARLQDQWIERLRYPPRAPYTPKPFPVAVRLEPEKYLQIPAGYRRQRPAAHVERLRSSAEWREFYVDLMVFRSEWDDAFQTLAFANERVERGEFDKTLEPVDADRSQALQWWLRCRAAAETPSVTGGYVLRARPQAGQNDLLMVAHYKIFSAKAEPAQTAARELIDEVKWRD